MSNNISDTKVGNKRMATPSGNPDALNGSLNDIDDFVTRTKLPTGAILLNFQTWDRGYCNNRDGVVLGQNPGVTNPFAKTTEKINRDFYDTKVKPYKGNTKSTYEDYITSRGKGEVDTMGRTISQKDGENTIKKVTKTAPTVAEVDQATTNTAPTETAETTEKNRLLKVKKRGRSSSIMTGAKGVTKTSADYSLGRPSLLGRV